MFFERLAQSADLVKGMAARTGFDFGTPGNAAQFKQMTLACSGCENQGACRRLQAANDTLDATPDYCQNAVRFND